MVDRTLLSLLNDCDDYLQRQRGLLVAPGTLAEKTAAIQAANDQLAHAVSLAWDRVTADMIDEVCPGLKDRSRPHGSLLDRLLEDD
jgi:hypothetical protein